MKPEPALTTPRNLVHQVGTLWKRQVESWPRLADGVASLRAASFKTVELDRGTIEVQGNPARIRSACADIKAKPSAERPCFLCEAQLPEEQQAICYRDAWWILCNPAPLFEPHLTIAHVKHQPQRLEASIEPLLALARDLNGAYTVFYNGPLCGASMPDHLHLQATPAGATPFERELGKQLSTETHHDPQRWLKRLRGGPTRLYLASPSHRPVVVIVGDSDERVVSSLEGVLVALGRIQPAAPEPMVNVFVTWADDRWIVWLFPRAAHRPRCYGTGPEDYIISPGCVDLAGVLIVPRPEDFQRVDGRLAQAVYREVLLSPGAMAQLRDALSDDEEPG